MTSNTRTHRAQEGVSPEFMMSADILVVTAGFGGHLLSNQSASVNGGYVDCVVPGHYFRCRIRC